MIRLIKRVFNATVFAPVSDPHSVSDTLATLFHRSAATTYLIIAIWGVISWFVGLRTLSTLWGDPIQDSYSLLVTAAALIAFYGATFFPKHARTELMAASALVGLQVLYTASLGWYVLAIGDTLDTRIPLLILSMTTWVMPVARSVFVYRLLVSTAPRG